MEEGVGVEEVGDVCGRLYRCRISREFAARLLTGMVCMLLPTPRSLITAACFSHRSQRERKRKREREREVRQKDRQTDRQSERESKQGGGRRERERKEERERERERERGHTQTHKHVSLSLSLSRARAFSLSLSLSFLSLPPSLRRTHPPDLTVGGVFAAVCERCVHALPLAGARADSAHSVTDSRQQRRVPHLVRPLPPRDPAAHHLDGAGAS